MYSGNKTDEPYITRINYPNRDYGSYWVRFLQNTNTLSQSRQKHLRQKSFPDLQYGGPEQALMAAKLWRDKTKVELKIPYDYRTRFPRKAKTKSNTATGIVGVTKSIDKKNLVNGGMSFFFAYKANWRQMLNGKRVNRSKQFGYEPWDLESEEAALKKAVEIRRKMEKLHYDPR